MFGSSSSTSNTSTTNNNNPQADVLAGGFGGGLGNGFGNMTSAASTSSNASGSGGATSFDLSDFPSLGGGVAGGAGNNNGLAQALRQQQLLAQQQQAASLLGGTATTSSSSTASAGSKPTAPVGGNANNNAASAMYRLAMTGTHGNNFTIAKEDFPALGSSLLGGTSVANATATNATSSSNPSSVIHRTTTNSSSTTNNASPSNGAIPGLYDSTANANSDSASGGLEGTGLLGGTGASSLGLGGLPTATRSAANTSNSGSSTSNNNSSANTSNNNNSTTNATNNSNANAGSALQGDYGLLGLLGVIRMTDADRNALALGSDLTLLGLNLGTAEQIYSTFASPWADATSKEPHYELPSCYYMQPPALKTGHLSKFQLETLFYIFYALPKDVLQAYAAQELYSREWRYHGELKLWFKRASTADGLTATAASTGQYLYFDINTWERRLFNGNMNQNITNGFLPEGEVQVKFSQS